MFFFFFFIGASGSSLIDRVDTLGYNHLLEQLELTERAGCETISVSRYECRTTELSYALPLIILWNLNIVNVEDL